MQAQQLLSSIPQLFASTQSSEAATGAAISAVIAALKVWKDCTYCDSTLATELCV